MNYGDASFLAALVCKGTSVAQPLPNHPSLQHRMDLPAAVVEGLLFGDEKNGFNAENLQHEIELACDVIQGDITSEAADGSYLCFRSGGVDLLIVY